MGCCHIFAKGLLIIVTISNLISGLILIVASLWALILPTSFYNIISDLLTNHNELLQHPETIVNTYATTLYALLGVGIVMVVLSIIGCCGAITDNKCQLRVFVFFVILFLLAEISLGIMLILYHKETGACLKDSLVYSIKNDYTDTPKTSVSFMWDTIFTNLRCCGVNNRDDFKDSLYTNETQLLAPISCCNAEFNVTSCIGNELSMVNYYEKGCLTELSERFITERVFIGGSALLSVAIDILILISGVELIRHTTDKEITVVP